jgi:dihydrolipoamide dehydrogenase
MIGSYVSESIIGAAIFIDRQITVEEMKKIVFPHPTVCEVMREGLFM